MKTVYLTIALFISVAAFGQEKIEKVADKNATEELAKKDSSDEMKAVAAPKEVVEAGSEAVEPVEGAVEAGEEKVDSSAKAVEPAVKKEEEPAVKEEAKLEATEE